ncbi:Fibronectin type III [Candidatus Nanopelagicaceae bacterium]
MKSALKSKTIVLTLLCGLLIPCFSIASAPTSSAAAGSPGSIAFNEPRTNYLTYETPTAGFAFGTGDFTIEYWWKPTVDRRSDVLDFWSDPGLPGSAQSTRLIVGSSVGNGGPVVYIDSTVSGGAGGILSSSTSLSSMLNSWNHIALTRASGVFKFWLNGTEQGSYSSKVLDFGATGMRLYVMDDHSGVADGSGNLAGVRVVKGTAVYANNFSPSSSPLTAVSGTTLLLNTTNDGNFLKDDSANNLRFAAFGAPVSASASPFLSLSSNSETGYKDVLITGYTLTNPNLTENYTASIVGGGSFSSPTNGISFNTTTGLFSGTPTATASTVTYRVTGVTSKASGTYSLTVALPAQTISFTQPPNVVLGATPAALVATASPSGYTVTFASTTTGVCTVSGTALTILTAGTCSITASQNGNPSYSAATDVVKSFSVYSGSLSGTATFGQVLTANATAFTPSSYQWKRSATSGGIYTDIASATSSTYTLTGADVGNFVKVSMTSSDALVVTTSPTSSVGALSQTITFGALTGAKLTASPVTLSGAALATASSGLTPTYSSSTIETCTATSAGVITLKLVGTCTIVASQAGNSGYGAATPVSQNLIISADVPAAPFINSVSTGGDTTGTASVKFTPGASNGATIDSFTVTATNGGTTLTQMVLSGTGDSATVTGLTLGLPYTIAVKAYNSAGASLATTYGSTVTTASAPYAVTNLRTTQSAAGSLRVNFTPPASLNGGTALTYKYFIVPSGGTFSGTENYATAPASGSTITADPGYVFTGLTPSTAYDIKVVASTTGAGSSLESFTAVVSQIPAGVPTAPRLTLTQTDSQTVLVQWFAQSDNGSALVSPYFTKSVTVDGGSATCTGSSSTAAGGSCSVTGLVGGQVVSASAYATNIIGNSSTTTGNSSGVIGTVSAPTSLVATAGNSQISIAFNQVTNGDSVIYYRYSTNGVDYVVNSATTSPVVVTGLTNGTSYTIYLQAVGATNGAGPASASVVATPIAPATGPAPVVLGPPPSTFVVVANPKISRSGTSLVCTSGTYKFKKQGGKEEASSITSQLISLLSNGAVVDSEKTLESQSTFEGKPSYKGTTLSCEVGIKQEEVVKTYSSLDPAGIASYEAAMTAAIYGANTTYYSERDAAYLKRDAGDTKVWKEMLDKALLKREDTKVQAGVDYLANLEKAGISILIALDKAAPAPTPVPAPTPTPTKSPEVSVTGNVQPAAMKKVGTIYFASGTYFLNDESKKTIKALATSIFMKSPATVLSYGFTDSKGGTDNTVLSQNRAKAVAKLLRSLLPGQKIATGWYASSKPVATGTSKAALAKNRRVEIYIK